MFISYLGILIRSTILLRVKCLSHWTKQNKSQFLAKAKYFFWDDPYLFKYYPDQIIRRCVSDNVFIVLFSFVIHACGGHFSSKKIAINILQCGFYWPSIFHDYNELCKACD